MTKIIFLFCFGVFTSVYSQKNNADIQQVHANMNAQQIAWNKANIESFMDFYWKNDSLKFIGSSGITYGWQKTLDNYKKRYPTAEAMGQLTFTILETEQLSTKSIFLIGKWNLKYTDKEVGGYFTLFWKKLNGKWVIVMDHTS